jgi:hypothetical protein
MFTGPNIVRDGLVLALDAANTKSYPGSGTTWYDLSGNSNSGTLYNGLTFSSNFLGTLDFDGTNDYIDLGSDITISPANQGWTAVYVFNTDDATTLQHFNSAENDEFNANWLALLSSYLAVWDRTQNIWKYGSTQFSSNTWYHIAFVQESGTSMQFYVNGVPEGGNHTSFAWSSSKSALITRYVGRYEYAGSYGRYFNGEIPVVQMYNRALSASEVLQNYNATKTRFGL